MNISSKNAPVVSVIMPTYNQGKFIAEAIDSVIGQTFPDFELIIVDNYSTDNTESVVGSYDDPRVYYIKFNNKGVIAASRNVGIKQARGGLVSFLDSDDVWAKDKLKQQVEFFRENPETGLLSGAIRLWQGQGKPFGEVLNFRMPREKRVESQYRSLIKSNFIATSAVIIKKSILEKVGYFDEDPALVSVEDWDLWLRIARQFSISLISDILVFYRVHTTNTSSEIGRFERNMQIFKKHYKSGFISENEMSELLFNNYLKWSLSAEASKAPGILLEASRLKNLLFYNRIKLSVFVWILRYTLLRKCVKYFYNVFRHIRTGIAVFIMNEKGEQDNAGVTMVVQK